LAAVCETTHSQTTGKFRKVLSFYAGMGVDYGITPDFNDFLVASIPYSTGDSIRSFNAGVEFFGGIEYELSKTFSLRADYSYYVRSFTYTFSPAVFDYTITSHQPYLFGGYIMRYTNVDLKLCAGIGYHLQQLDNKINSSTTIGYSSSGPSIRAEVIIAPKLSKNFHGYLSGFAFGNFYGKLKDDSGNTLKAANSNTEASLSGYGVGARLGFIINLN
jgi:hypothetical protein